MSRLRSSSSKAGSKGLLHQFNEYVAVDALRDRATSAASSARSAAGAAASRSKAAASGAPSPADLAQQLRDSRAADAAMAGAAAVLPAVGNALADALQRKAIRRALAVTPVVAKRSALSKFALMFGGTGAALMSAFVAHRAWRNYRVRKAMRDEEITATSGDERQEVARMDHEGPMPGAYDGEPVPISGVVSDGGSTRIRR